MGARGGASRALEPGLVSVRNLQGSIASGLLVTLGAWREASVGQGSPRKSLPDPGCPHPQPPRLTQAQLWSQCSLQDWDGLAGHHLLLQPVALAFQMHLVTVCGQYTAWLESDPMHTLNQMVIIVRLPFLLRQGLTV